jgi:hypothetical protein
LGREEVTRVCGEPREREMRWEPCAAALRGDDIGGRVD